MRYLIKLSDDSVVQVPDDDDLTFTTLVAVTANDAQGIAKPAYEQVGRDHPLVVAVGVGAPGTGFAAFTCVSGTAHQDTTGRKSTVLVPITGGSAGTVKVEIGPTSAVAHIAHPLVAANAVASQLLSIPLPANWYIKVTAATATITAGSQLW